MNTAPGSDSTLPTPPPAAPGPPFSQELQQLLVRFDQRPVRLHEMLSAARGRGDHLLLLLIALPFVGPVPLPGFSLPFGLVVAVLGLRLALDRGSWLPQRILQREVSPAALRRIIGASSRVVAGVEYLVRPRWSFVPHHAVFSRVAGVLVGLSGVLLMLPLPLPFSNSLPAWTVILLAAGALGADGVFFFAGCAMFLLSLAFFAFVFFGGFEVFERLRANLWC